MFAPIHVTLAPIALAAGDPDPVSVHALVPASLVGQGEPIPSILVENEGKQPIAIELFEGVPQVWLEAPEAPAADPGGRCGNGYVPTTISPGQTARFPMWSAAAGGPGASGDYRAAISYSRQGVYLEARSEVFSLRYGDVAPPGWSGGRPGEVALLRAQGERVREGIDPPPAAEVGRQLLPAVERCVAAAQARLPWLRGGFSLKVYQYPSQPEPVSFLDGSLLGDAEVNRCLGGITPPRVDGAYNLDFAVTLPR
jgi:hypothetical protein